MLKKYQTYLFDLDGTLANTEELKAQALSLSCKDFNAEVAPESYQTVMGQTWDRVLDCFFQAGGITVDTDVFNEHFRHHYEALLPKKLSLQPFALEYLKELKQQGITCGLVSSADRWKVDHVLNTYQLERYFDVIVTKESVTHHKPSPEAYLLALNTLNVAAETTVIIEDSTAGLEAAVASGCDVIAFKHKYNQDHNLSLACKVITSYQTLCAEL